MTAWLIRRFVKDYENTENGEVRAAYGTLGSCVGILVNLLLSAGKFLIGLLSGSVAILADAANNLSDAAGSIVALVSTRVARKPVDAEHPFGHGRMEYLGSLGVGLLILVMAFTLLKEGMEAILTPAALSVSWPVLTVLGVSIAVKAWLYFFYRRLGRATDNGTLLAASMMGDMLKEDNGALTLQIKGGGPLGTILAVSDCGGNVRGYVQDPHVELMEKVPGKLDVGAAVGTDGSLTVIKDLGLKEPYIGSIGLFSGEIADDIAMYFVESEQIPTACALGVLVDRDQSVLAAGGYLIQLLPGAEEGLIDKIEAGVRRVGSVSHALSRGLDAQGLLEEVLSDFQLEVLETHPVEYRCSCSRERVSRALISMGREELSSLIAEQGQADLSCQFCDKVYHFSKEELEGLLSSM